jgi:hypothetical protein
VRGRPIPETLVERRHPGAPTDRRWLA